MQNATFTSRGILFRHFAAGAHRKSRNKVVHITLKWEGIDESQFPDNNHVMYMDCMKDPSSRWPQLPCYAVIWSRHEQSNNMTVCSIFEYVWKRTLWMKGKIGKRKRDKNIGKQRDDGIRPHHCIIFCLLCFLPQRINVRTHQHARKEKATDSDCTRKTG